MKTRSKPKHIPSKASGAVVARARFPAWLPLLLLGALTVLAYQPLWHAGFIWDDDAYVEDNVALRSAGGLVQIWDKLTATPQYYPLVHTTFWLEYHLWGLNPLGFHLDNVLLHLLAAFLLWRVLVRLQLPGASLAAGIFALHPVNVESVAWVTERKNVLAAVFYFAAALAYWRWREPDPPSLIAKAGKGVSDKGQGSPSWYVVAFVLFVAALLSKTVTCSLPAALLLVVWWQRGRIAGRDVWPLLPFFGAGVALGLTTSWLERTHVGASGPEWAFSFFDRCLIAGRAVWFYAGKLFWPANLTFIYPRWQINTREWWQWIFPVAALGVVGVLWGLRRRIGRGPLVAVLLFGGTLFPALGFTNVYPMRFSFVADHFQYLASVGLIALAVAGLWKIPRLIPSLAVLLPLGLGVLTWRQARIYSDQETLWRDTLVKNPSCWVAHNYLGFDSLNRGRYDEAISEFQDALRLNPDYAEARFNLGLARENEGQNDAAIHEYQEALRLRPDYVQTHYNLGIALAKKGQIDDAIHQYEEAILLNPDYTEAHNNLGTLFYGTGQIDDAIVQFQETIRLKPDYAEPHNNLGAACYAKGRIDEAISEFQKALRLKPDFADARDNLSRAEGTKNPPAGK